MWIYWTLFWWPALSALGVFQTRTSEEIARSMADDLVHRGPDDSGVWLDSAGGIALSHRRLSIVDLSPEGHQPMASASGRSISILD